MEFKEWEARMKESMRNMHFWNDGWPHWRELYDAERYIQKHVYKYSLCMLHSKEKWGQLRYTAVYPPGSKAWWLSVKLPWKQKIVKLGGTFYVDKYLFQWPASWLYDKWMDFGQWTLRRVVKKASKKFSNVVREINADLGE